MTERFIFGDATNLVFDTKESKSYGTYNITYLIKLMNELDAGYTKGKQAEQYSRELLVKEQALRKENEQLNRLLNIIADADSARSETSVKEILRNNLFGLDTVAGESFNAYKDYTLLNNFFKEHYGEHWDNDKYD